MTSFHNRGTAVDIKILANGEVVGWAEPLLGQDKYGTCYEVDANEHRRAVQYVVERDLVRSLTNPFSVPFNCPVSEELIRHALDNASAKLPGVDINFRLLSGFVNDGALHFEYAVQPTELLNYICTTVVMRKGWSLRAQLHARRRAKFWRNK